MAAHLEASIVDDSPGGAAEKKSRFRSMVDQLNLLAQLLPAVLGLPEQTKAAADLGAGEQPLGNDGRAIGPNRAIGEGTRITRAHSGDQRPAQLGDRRELESSGGEHLIRRCSWKRNSSSRRQMTNHTIDPPQAAEKRALEEEEATNAAQHRFSHLSSTSQGQPETAKTQDAYTA